MERGGDRREGERERKFREREISSQEDPESSLGPGVGAPPTL